MYDSLDYIKKSPLYDSLPELLKLDSNELDNIYTEFKEMETHNSTIIKESMDSVDFTHNTDPDEYLLSHNGKANFSINKKPTK